MKNQRHYFANKCLSSQSFGFSGSHVWMWELDYKESWALKNRWFWTVVLEKTLESLLDSKEIQPVHPKGNQSWVFIGRTDAEAKLQYFGHMHEEPTHWKRPWYWDRLKVGGEGDDRGRVGWRHHCLNGQEFEKTSGAGYGQGGLACCSPWGHKESDTTGWLNWTYKIQGGKVDPFGQCLLKSAP